MGEEWADGGGYRYTLHDHDGRLVGEHSAGARVPVGECILHDDGRYLVVEGPPPRGARFVDPLFDGYALPAR